MRRFWAHNSAFTDQPAPHSMKSDFLSVTYGVKGGRDEKIIFVDDFGVEL